MSGRRLHRRRGICSGIGAGFVAGDLGGHSLFFAIRRSRAWDASVTMVAFEQPQSLMCGYWVNGGGCLTCSSIHAPFGETCVPDHSGSDGRRAVLQTAAPRKTRPPPLREPLKGRAL